MNLVEQAKSAMVKVLSVSLAIFMCASIPATASVCDPGAYVSNDGDFVVVVNRVASSAHGQRYQFRDGQRGFTSDSDSMIQCSQNAVEVKRPDGEVRSWPKFAVNETNTEFASVGTTLVGQLIEPQSMLDGDRPLVVMVHGSERMAAIGNAYAYALVAQGISVFVYDKRGTGGSAGEYTQNFELLAADAAAAFTHASRLAHGRFGRAGYFGGSQGGWVAPLAATRSNADFVAVGFGLVASPIEEDREQMISEARAMGLTDDTIPLINQLSDATAKLLLSDFKDGYRQLGKIRRKLTRHPWLTKIAGEHSGAILKMTDDELRQVGAARFDNLELIWDYDSVSTLERLNVPLLWVLAGEDREAPVEGTRRALKALKKTGKPVDVYLFPNTDHGMVEYHQNPDGTRTITRITDGYLSLLGDWIKGVKGKSYGRSIVISN
jgi:uncharacterized protein